MAQNMADSASVVILEVVMEMKFAFQSKGAGLGYRPSMDRGKDVGSSE